MKCSHCCVTFHESWTDYAMLASNGRGTQQTPWHYRATICPECKQEIVDVGREGRGATYVGSRDWTRVVPVTASRGPLPAEVPPAIAEDYVEACNVLPISSKASAALSRRCLQAILRAAGYTAKDLAKAIDELLNESDPRKAIPDSLRVVVDGIRNFGNFSAHPVTDLTTTQIVAVEPEEAEWCLEILEECFQHFYVRPKQALARKAALDAKLAAAGKPPSKT